MTDMDWSNLAQVKAYAVKLGKGQMVVKHKSRPNYNITHASRNDLWNVPGCEVLFCS